MILILFICLICFTICIGISTGFNTSQCIIPKNNDRLDCFPQLNANQYNCLSRGCCWFPPLKSNSNLKEIPISIPHCYYPTNYPNYFIESLTKSNRGIKVKLIKHQQTYLPNEILSLNFEVIYETKSRARIRITDSENERFEVPIRLTPPDYNLPTNLEYEVIIPPHGIFSIEVKRKSDNQSLFKSFGPLLYSDQFIQISSLMSTDQVYGMGEQNRPFLHQLSNGWTRIGLWARDNPIETYKNLYGTHPFYMGMPEDGKAFGVFYFNSNAQEFVLQPTPAITYRTIGGVLDIFIFTGGSPEETVKQYVELVGKPMLPPYWSLGFHLSKYGYKNVSEIAETLHRNIDAGVLINIQWADIDYMDKRRDFTVDPINFGGFKSFINFIKKQEKIRFIPIVDAGIHFENSDFYPPYDEGLQLNIYIKDSITNESIVGKSWPGEVVYPDFTHPNITTYWYKQIHAFYNLLPFDGLWIDMNEPSNFYEGSKFGCPRDNKYDYPVFVPDIKDKSLIIKTICPSSLHYNNVKHYNLHNLYGYTQSVCTNNVLIKMTPRKRPFVLSRSTFSGSGKYTFHWTGDNNADWDNLKNSIRQILNFNMFGIPMTGADICGFNGNSNEELCIRWMQLGAFYPFMRNHNSVNTRDQDPASWSKEAQQIMKTAINIRYALLPTFYTLLVKSHLFGGTVMRPMSFEFYSDKNTHSLDLQFMIGSSIMVMPVVNQGEATVNAYFPGGIWYDYHNGSILYSNEIGDWKTLQSPLESINVAIKGGSIVPLFAENEYNELSQTNDIELIWAPSKNMSATGEMYVDDGEDIDSYNEMRFDYFTFLANSEILQISPAIFGYDNEIILKRLVILGIKKNSIKDVLINNISTTFHFKSQFEKLVLNNLNLSMESVITIELVKNIR